MRLTSLAHWNCSIAKTLDVVGEWWTLLILRDAFGGTRRFDDFQASLGLARSVLTARLEKLTDHGILERRAYTQHPPRYEYHLTEKGRALFPVGTALLTWGDQWAPTPGGPPVLLVHGTHDPVVPIAALHTAQSELKRLCIAVSTHISSGVGHSVDPVGLRIGCDFVSQALIPKA